MQADSALEPTAKLAAEITLALMEQREVPEP